MKSKLLFVFICFLLFTPRKTYSSSDLYVKELLYPKNLKDIHSPLLRNIARTILTSRNKNKNPIKWDPRVYVRVVSKKYILNENNLLKKNSLLGGRPFVFVTVPKILHKTSLLEIFSYIGYSAKEILLTQKNVEKVAIIFIHNYKKSSKQIKWINRIYPATWENLIFLLKNTMSSKEFYTIGPKNKSPLKLSFRDEEQRKMLDTYVNYHNYALKSLQQKSYTELQKWGGLSWMLREFLQKSLGASKHFLGNGKSKNTLFKKINVSEFLVKNRKLSDMERNFFIISLGKL